MAYYTPRHHDFGEQYKLFKDLKDNDNIYVIDYETIQTKTYTVNNVKVENKSDYFNENYYIVEFNIPEIDQQYALKACDGNTYIQHIRVKYDELFFTTDKRIAESICEIMRYRNSYQWNHFTSLFGNPMARYADKPVILC